MKAVQIVNPSEMKVVELEKPTVGVSYENPLPYLHVPENVYRQTIPLHPPNHEHKLPLFEPHSEDHHQKNGY